MGRTLKAKGTLIDDKVRFTVKTRADSPQVTFDFFPPIGTGEGYTGLEGLLMSLAVCAATTVIYLLRKGGREVSGCEVNASGSMKDLPEVGFESAVLRFSLSGSDITDEDVDKALELARDSACPVWQMVRGNFRITADYEIV